MRKTLKQNPWTVQDQDFPTEENTAQKLQFLLNYAVLAPSSHNTQPWHFILRENTVELHLDPTRSLPIADPEHRELIISCGAALFNLRLAIQHFSYQDLVTTFPEPNQPNLLARISLGEKYCAPSEIHQLFQVITQRRTYRLSFAEKTIPEAILNQLQQAVKNESAWIHWIKTETERNAIADLIEASDAIQMADPQYRQELATWIHSEKSTTQDGIPPNALGINQWLDVATPVITKIIKIFNMGKQQAEKDRQMLLKSPILAVIGTDENTPQAWLATGQALSRMLLCACLEDISASYFNQIIQLLPLRYKLGEIIHKQGFPQLLLRLGYGKPLKPTPRREIQKVIRA
jgi:hypothetical protein